MKSIKPTPTQTTIEDALRDAKKAQEPPRSFSGVVMALNPPEPRTPGFGPRQKQRKAVYRAMKHGRWMTLQQVAYLTGVPEPNVSALLRQLATDNKIPHVIVRKESQNWYRLAVPRPAANGGNSLPLQH